jgi:hypothetical protein
MIQKISICGKGGSGEIVDADESNITTKNVENSK